MAVNHPLQVRITAQRTNETNICPCGNPCRTTALVPLFFLTCFVLTVSFLAIFSFAAQGEHQISLAVGEKVKVQERSRDGNWYIRISFSLNRDANLHYKN